MTSKTHYPPIIGDGEDTTPVKKTYGVNDNYNSTDLTPEEAGKGFFKWGDIDIIVYSDGSSYWHDGVDVTNYSLYQLQQLVSNKSIATVYGLQTKNITTIAQIPLLGTISATTVITTVSGWGTKFNTTPGLRFSHLKVGIFQQTQSSEAQYWNDITLNIKKNDKDGAILATGKFVCSPMAASFTNVVFELFLNGVPVTLTETELGSVYWVEYYARNRDGAACGIGLSSTTIAPSNLAKSVEGDLRYELIAGGFWALATGLTNYKMAVEPQLYSDVQVTPALNAIQNKVMLTSQIFGVAGREMNIYFDGLNEYRYKDLSINLTCTIGKQQNERWTHVPVAAAPATPFIVNIYDPNSNALLASKTVSLNIAAAAQAATETILCIGDSTTAGSEITDELIVLDTANANTAFTFIGTQGTGASLHEGRGGWTWEQFVGTGSPFYISSKLDFAAYITNNGFAAPTRVVIHLGINDIFSYSTDATALNQANSMLVSMGKLISTIQRYSATVKIGICLTIPPSATQNAFGKQYNTDQQVDRYRRNLGILWDTVIAKYDGKTANKIWLIPYHVSIDTENNMKTETVAVNSRNSSTVVRQTDAVHPHVMGYNQLADALYAWILCTQ